MADEQIKLPEGYEDAKPVNEDNSQQQVSLPPGYEDATPVAKSAEPAASKAEPSMLDKAEGVAKKGWEAVNTPLAKPSDEQQAAYMKAKDYSTSVPTEEESKHPIWTGIKKGAAGALADTTDTIRGFTSPLGVATLAAGPLTEAGGAVGKAAGALGKIAGVGFGAQGAKEAVQGGEDIAKNGLTPENTRQTLGGAGQAVLGATAGHEMISKGAKLIHDLPEVDAKIKTGVQNTIDKMTGRTAKGLVGNEYTPPAKGAVPPAKTGALPRIEYATPTPNGAEPNLVGAEHGEGTAPAHEAPVTPKGSLGRIEYAEPTPNALTASEPGLVGNEHTEAQAPAGEAQPRNPVQGVEYSEHQPAATTPDKEITPEMVKSTPGTSMSPEGKALVDKIIGKQEEPAAKEPDMEVSKEITKGREAKQAEQQTARDKEIAEEGGYTEPGKTNPKATGSNKPVHSDEAHMAQAREELGEAAPTSKIMERAKELQDEAGKAHEARAAAPKEEAGPAKSSSEAQLAAHEANGGSTFSPEGEDQMGQDKYSVGSYPERTEQFPDLTDADLRKFKADNSDLLGQPDHAIGSWKDPDTGTHVLDVVKLYGDKDEAIAAGKAANQKGIFGLKNADYIETGGTGEGTVDEAKAQAGAESKVEPEHVANVNNIVKDLNEQDIIKAGKKYDVDHEDYDFKKRDENRHRVERDSYAKDVTEKIPDEMKAKLVKAEQDFDDEDSNVFDQAARNSASKAARAKAIWDKAHEPDFDVKEHMAGKTAAPEATAETARMSDEQLKAAGFTPEDIENGRHLPEVGGGAKGKATGTDIIPEEANKHMTDEERQGLRSDLGRRNFVDRLKSLPKVQEFIDAAIKGQGGRKWYQRSSAAFDALAEEAPRYFQAGDRQKFTDFVASLSPQQTVTMNLKEALNAWTKYVDAGRPEGKQLQQLLYEHTTLPDAKVPNAMKALAGEDLWPDISKSKAFKVPSFARNLNNYLNYVTNDGWQALFGGLKASEISSPTSYHPLSVMTRAAADALGWEPAEAQAAIWAFTKAFTEHGETDPIVIRQMSEDFADIMANDPEVRELLGKLGVDHEQLDAKLGAIGEKPAITERPTPTTENSTRKLSTRIKQAGREIPKPKDQRSLDYTAQKGDVEEEGDTSFEPEKLEEKSENAIPLKNLYDRSSVLVAPDGKLSSIDEYNPRGESQHAELLRKSGYKGDLTKFLKEGGVRAYTTGPEEAGVEIQNNSPETIKRALRVVDDLGREKTKFEIADPKTFKTIFSTEGTYHQIKNALDKR